MRCTSSKDEPLQILSKGGLRILHQGRVYRSTILLRKSSVSDTYLSHSPLIKSASGSLIPLPRWSSYIFIFCFFVVVGNI